MNSRIIIKKIKLLIVFFVITISVVSFLLAKTYSSHVLSSSLNSSSNLLTNKFNYELRIDDKGNNTINIKPGNSVIKLNIKSLNSIDSYYKLFYSNNDNLNIYYINNYTDLLNQFGKIEVMLFVSNKSSNIENLSLYIDGNSNKDDIFMDNSYTQIVNSIKVGDYIDYYPSGIENITKYDVLSSYSGVQFDQSVYLKSSKYRIYNINLDGTIDIISEKSLSIDEYNNKLKLSGSLGYNNSKLILNNIVSYVYNNPSYIINARNIDISDILNKLKSSTKYVTNNYYLDNIYYVNETNNELSTNSYMYGSYNIVEQFYEFDIDKSNYVNEIYYDLINNTDEYYLSNSYVIKNDNVRYGIYSIYNNMVYYNDLYFSNNNVKTSNYNLRPILTLSSNVNLSFINNSWIIE